MLKIIALFSLCLLISCKSYVPVPPNPELTKDCDYPKLQGETYRDAINLTVRRGQALEDCTDRMRSLRK